MISSPHGGLHAEAPISTSPEQTIFIFATGYLSGYHISSIKDDEFECENEWERLLKPFGLKELRRSLYKITPFQLCKLLELPLDVSTSLELFQWAGAQREYCHSFEVYFALIDKLGMSKEFKVIDRLLLKMKEEGVVFRDSLFIVIMKYYGRAGLLGQATRLLLEIKDVFFCEPSFRSYNVVLDILVATNCPSEASNIFYYMLRKGVSPTVYTFDVVMKALCMVIKHRIPVDI
ncbi:hypothetical protein K2173_015594 [Erythroxylum novogranatense]|uniref:Pentatricopeptide repeat-containing protein n=1 Tax=Erythroxylum novogranatense TaxID=1862640 RepID=A0AAV8SEJ3_9ROSI|nr:hypothetical protein K2173_015594 [Erythroxylum novogranatense]